MTRSRLSRFLLLLVTLGALGAGCEGDRLTERSCSNGLDDDGDGQIDCLDPDCATAPECQGPVCGDLVREGDEECDGLDSGGASCTSLGFAAGALACRSDCTHETTGCTPAVCGDDRAEGPEDCDGLDMGSGSCALLGHLGGDLACAGDCTYDTTGCFDEVTCSDVTLPADVPVCVGGVGNGGNYAWIYNLEVDLGEALPYQLQIELWGDVAGGIVTGTHALGAGTEGNYRTCAYCTLLRKCADASCQNFTRSYLNTAGTLELTTLGQAPAGHLVGSLSGVNWVEVEINPQTLDSTPLPAGACFDLAAPYSFDATVVPAG
jgi:hypothetical protein